MAKVSQISDAGKGYTIPMIQLKNDLVINQQVYNLDDLYPVPFKNMSFKTENNYGSYSMTGTSDFIFNTQGPAYGFSSSCWALRGRRDGNFVYGSNFMVDNDDTDIGWYLMPDGAAGDDSTYLYKISLTSKEILAVYSVVGAIYGAVLLGVDSTHVYGSAISTSSSYAYCLPFSFNKTTLGVTTGGNSAYRYAMPSYFTEDASYLWMFANSTYGTATTYIHRVDKSTGSWINQTMQASQDAGRDCRSIPSQVRALDADTDACYAVWPTTNTTNVYEIYKYQVVKSTQSISSTQCTLDFATAGVTRSDVLNGFTNTANGESNIESWMITGGSSDYMCFTVSEHVNSETEASGSFHIYIFKIETTDTNLTYIGKIDPALRIRNVMPLEADWTKIAVIYDGGMKIYTWNSGDETYDYTDSYAADVNSVMIDKNERVWVLDTSNQLHMFSATTPIRITVTMQNATYNYTGSTINTYANVSAWDTDGNRVATSVKLVLEGSAEFTNSSQSYTFTTSASADTQVNINITGSSYSRAIASVVV